MLRAAAAPGAGVAAGATRAALTQHFARTGNAADVAAKEGSQARPLEHPPCARELLRTVGEAVVCLWLGRVLARVALSSRQRGRERARRSSTECLGCLPPNHSPPDAAAPLPACESHKVLICKQTCVQVTAYLLASHWAPTSRIREA